MRETIGKEKESGKEAKRLTISNFLDMQFHLLRIRRESDRPTRFAKITSRSDYVAASLLIRELFQTAKNERKSAEKKIWRQKRRNENERTDRASK